MKNARGHGFFEYGEPMLDEPDAVLFMPIPAMRHDELREFEDVPQTVWPEVGIRMMTRVMTGQDLEGAWGGCSGRQLSFRGNSGRRRVACQVHSL